MVLASFVCITTMRYKEMAIIILIWFLYLRSNYKSNKIRNRLFSLFASVIIVVLFGFDQLTLYYGNEGTARSLLLKNSFFLANKYFPFGAGFAAYGSNMARVYYSNLYYQFGFNKIWGMSPGYSGYLTDSFFPIVIGQFGWISIILIIIIFWGIFKKTLVLKNNNQWICAISLVAYLLISTLGGSSIFNPISVLIAIILSNINVSVSLVNSKEN